VSMDWQAKILHGVACVGLGSKSAGSRIWGTEFEVPENNLEKRSGSSTADFDRNF